MTRQRIALASILVTLVAATTWLASRPSSRVLTVTVHEGRIRLETPQGDLEVPTGSAGRGGRKTAPFLMAEAAAEEAWREPLQQEPAWKKALQEKLKTTRVVLKLDQQPFRVVKEYLANGNDIPINVDKAARDAKPQLDDALVNLITPEQGVTVTLETAINLLTKTVGLSWELRDEAVVITTQDHKGKPGPFVAPKEKIPDALQKQLGMVVRFRMEQQPFAALKEYIEGQQGIAIYVDKSATDANPKLNAHPMLMDDAITVDLSSSEKGVSMASVLNWLCDEVGMRWTIQEGTVVIATDEGVKRFRDAEPRNKPEIKEAGWVEVVSYELNDSGALMLTNTILAQAHIDRIIRETGTLRHTCVHPKDAQKAREILRKAIQEEGLKATVTEPANVRVSRLFQAMRGESKEKLDTLLDKDGFPKDLGWDDIPALLALGGSHRTCGYPANHDSSIILFNGAREGMTAMWLVEGVREGSHFASLVPQSSGNDDDETQGKVLAAYQAWWEKVHSMPREEASKIDPMEKTGLIWR